MKYPITVKRENYYKDMLTAINCFLNLTKQEINILSVLLTNNMTELTEDSRSIIRETMNKSSFNINNYIKRLKNKGVFIPIEGKYIVNPSLLESLSTGEIHIQFNIKD